MKKDESSRFFLKIGHESVSQEYNQVGHLWRDWRGATKNFPLFDTNRNSKMNSDTITNLDAQFWLYMFSMVSKNHLWCSVSIIFVVKTGVPYLTKATAHDTQTLATTSVFCRKSPERLKNLSSATKARWRSRLAATHSNLPPDIYHVWFLTRDPAFNASERKKMCRVLRIAAKLSGGTAAVARLWPISLRLGVNWFQNERLLNAKSGQRVLWPGAADRQLLRRHAFTLVAKNAARVAAKVCVSCADNQVS